MRCRSLNHLRKVKSFGGQTIHALCRIARPVPFSSPLLTHRFEVSGGIALQPGVGDFHRRNHTEDQDNEHQYPRNEPVWTGGISVLEHIPRDQCVRKQQGHPERLFRKQNHTCQQAEAQDPGPGYERVLLDEGKQKYEQAER